MTAEGCYLNARRITGSRKDGKTLRIPWKEMSRTDYPCGTQGLYTKIFVATFIFLFGCLLGLKRCQAGHPEDLPVLLLMPLIPAAIFISATLFFEIRLVKRIVRRIENGHYDAAELWGYLKFPEGDRLSFALRRQPEILLLIAKLLESYAASEKDAERLEAARELTATAVKYAPELAPAAENGDLAAIAGRIRKLDGLFLFESICRILGGTVLLCLTALTFAGIVIDLIGLLIKVLKP